MKEKRNKQKGITLIALIITIIVLLILAGITIATLTGEHGILKQVDNAKVKTIEARVYEEIDLAVQLTNLEIMTKIVGDNSWNTVTEGILPTTAIEKTPASSITNEETNGAVLVTLLADLQRRGYNVEVTAVEGEGTEATRQITITYEGSDYKKATKKDNAKITKTLDVSHDNIIYGDCRHRWEDGEVIAEASCSVAGSKKQICTICGETRTVEIAKLEHTYGADEVCIVCGAKKLKIGAKINYHEYLNEAGTAFTTMPSYTSKKEQTGHSEDQVFTVANNSGIEWIILGEENGQIKITTKDYVKPTTGTTLTLYGKTAHENFVNELNAIGAIYGKGKYADTSKFQGGTTGGRSFIMEDLGYNKLTRTAGYTYALEQHEGDTQAKVYRYNAGKTPDGTSTTGGSGSIFEYMEQDASTSTEEGAYTWKTLSAENPSVTMYQYNYTGSQTLSTSIAKTASGTYWLASRYLSFGGSVTFCPRCVNSGGYSDHYTLFNSTGGSMGYRVGVRPVVYLKSDIQLSDYDSTNGYTILELGT